MNKVAYLVLILALVSPGSSAQQFRHFPDSASWTIWSYAQDPFVCLGGYAWSYSIGDTITIAGKSYRIVNTEGKLVIDDPCGGWSPQSVVAVREDTVLDKVFILYDGDTTEYVLFDYSAGVGDTISSLNGIESVVDSTDTVMIIGNSHRRWYFSNNWWSMFGVSFIIEGIGSNFGLFESLGDGIDFWSELICVKDSSGILYQSLSSNQFYCDWQGLVPSVSETANLLFTVFPNPASGLLRIEAETQFNHIQVVNTYGEIVVAQRTLTNSAIDLTHLSSGIYFLVIKQDEIRIHEQRLVILR